MRTTEEPSGSMRFSFGKNWQGYSGTIKPQDVDVSVRHMKVLLQVNEIVGTTFLDVGSGSGLSSLAATLMGADVVSFDYDPVSVKCTRDIQARYSCSHWSVSQGSVLDRDFMRSQGEFDYVYSWGVLHHTGDLETAMENVLIPLTNKGILYIALYNDQGWISKYWMLVKCLYNRNTVLKYMMILLHAPYLYFARMLYRKFIKRQPLERGMHLWFDMLDWLGGYPFEVIAPEDVTEFYRRRGLQLKNSVLCGRKHGCNEFVFQRK